jgi:predicted PurR-regulated permease PerM
MPSPPAPANKRLFEALDRAASYSWRLILVAIVGLASLWLLQTVRVVFFPVVIAVFLARGLTPVSGWLRRHRWRPGLAVGATMLGFFALLAGLTALVVPSIAEETESIGPTLTEAVDDVGDWLATDSPIEVSPESFQRLRDRVGTEAESLLESSDGAVADRAGLVAEIITGGVLALILTYFMMRDGRRFTEWVANRGAPSNRRRLRATMDAAWTALAGYLRGATMLGALESVVIGVTLWIAGAGLIAPVMLITFIGAYVPLVGAVLAGLIAVMVALVTGGTGAAIAVAVVALLVQQFDNDLLAPVIYGRALSLHPVAILLSVVAGGALFGLAGTVLAVPVVAVAVNAGKEWGKQRLDTDPTAPPDTGGPAPSIESPLLRP